VTELARWLRRPDLTVRTVMAAQLSDNADLSNPNAGAKLKQI